MQLAIWRCYVERRMGLDKTRKELNLSLWKVRQTVERWVYAGYVVKAAKGGGIATQKGTKWMDSVAMRTPKGSPLEAPHLAPLRGVDPHRVHRGKLKAYLDRDVVVDSLPYHAGASARECKAGAIVWNRFVLPCDTGFGTLGVPVQVVSPTSANKPHTVVVQSCNLLVDGDVLGEMSRQEALDCVRDAMQRVLDAWLGDAKASRLQWTGLDKEDLEVGWQAQADAPVGGNPQRDLVAVDTGSNGSPWPKEEEAALRGYQRLARLEVGQRNLEASQSRIVAALEELQASSAEQFDALAAAVEMLTKR